jgi:hypothetical protein
LIDPDSKLIQGEDGGHLGEVFRSIFGDWKFAEKYCQKTLKDSKKKKDWLEKVVGNIVDSFKAQGEKEYIDSILDRVLLSNSRLNMAVLLLVLDGNRMQKDLLKLGNHEQEVSRCP